MSGLNGIPVMSMMNQRIRRQLYSNIQRHDEIDHDRDSPIVINLIPINDLLKWKSENETSLITTTTTTTTTTAIQQDETSSSMISMQDNTNSLSFEGTEATLGLQAWRYSLFLGCSLLLWVLYLVLPKGVRKEYFGAYPKRHSKSTSAARKLGIGQWIHPISTVGSVFSNSRETSSMISGSVTEKNLAELAQARRAQLASLRDSREESSVRDDLSLGHSPEGWSRAESISRIQSPFMHSIESSSVKHNTNGRDRYDVGAAASVVSGWTGAVSWTSSWRSKTPQHEGGGGAAALPRIEIGRAHV